MDGSLRVRKFEDHLDFSAALNNLERMRHVHGARDTGLEAFELGIAVDPMLEIFFFASSRPGLVGNLVAFDDPDPSGSPTHRTEGDDGRSEHHRASKKAGLTDQGTCCVILKV